MRAMVRKSYKNYPVYNNVWTAPAPTRVELKYDVGQVASAVPSAGSINLISTIANGSGSSDRIGRRIAYHDIEIKWEFGMSASHAYNNVKTYIIYDNSPNGAAPIWTDLFVTAVPYSVQNPDTKGRFKIIWESNFISYDATTATFARCWFNNGAGHKVLSLKGKSAQFLGTTAGIADIEKGAIYFCMISDQNNVVQCNFQNKIQYSDA